MKKIILILPIFLFLFSCSDPETVLTQSPSDNASRPKPHAPVSDPTKLSRVVYYPGTDHERSWFFYPNGLLRKIVTSAGALIQDFSYDGHGNLATTHFYGDPYFVGSPYSITFTYDSSNHLTSWNGFPLVYNAANNTYLNEPATVTLNADLLMTGESYSYEEVEEPGEPPVQYTIHGVGVGYSNGNQTYHWEYDSPSATHYQHDSHPNPLRAAMLPICRAMGVVFFGQSRLKFLEGEYNSQNNIARRYYDIEDPENDRFEYTFNSLNLPKTRIRKSYYFNTLENTSLEIKYYYQGESITAN